MSVSNIVIKIIGVVLALVGLALLLSVVGIDFLSVSLSPWWVAVLVGMLFLGTGIWIIRGRNISI